MSSSQSNTYLERVVAQQAALEEDLRPSKAMAPAPAPRRSRESSPREESPSVAVRVTGFGRWKNVLVPPNAFVVHTRRGREKPVHIGLGISFRYNPYTDSYLVVPGTMQTILLNAFCICRELQGVVVQAYVQWIVADIETAYRGLDFSDRNDPMRLVNLQLKEQAEAAIKDKVATMSVREVLSDKQPIIEELTSRLRAVAEGNLGLRIVTVQIKEAVVSSTTLWENLQKPYRAEQNQIARLAELTTEEAVSARQAQNAAAAFDRDANEKLRRGEREQEDARKLAEQRDATKVHAIRLEQARHEKEVEIGRLRLELEHTLEQLKLEYELATATARAENENSIKLMQIERGRMRQDIDNGQTETAIQARLIATLPDIVAKLPKPTELRSVNLTGTADTTSLAGVIASLTAAYKALAAKGPEI
ncbi:SPFH domain-containing protein [Allorhizocola rhizosphaerae]|uniref:SPFH domain-containing protein n=1 Tax=Allorhizocola rhizosphaerae TaxID=1872709 RepID=UPI000E3C0F6F|nr:SPFH domain-containing protein [Allorhizocola rhizosphaerae]